MAAVFSGNGLGLFGSSWSRWGIAAGDTAQLGQGRDSQYVNVATGGLLLQGQDEQLVFRGLSVGQLRTYNSQGTVAQAGADGWVTGFERRVTLLSGTFDTSGSVMRVDTGDGGTQDFTWAGPGRYVSSQGRGADDSLTWSTASSTWTLVEGSTQRAWVFADHADPVQQGRLVQIRDLRSDGTAPAAWDVLYDANQRVCAIRAADGTGAGDALLFTYNDLGQLASVSTSEAGSVKHQVDYTYDTSGRLTEVLIDLTPDDGSDNTWSAKSATTNDGHLFRTVYAYEGSSLRIASVTQSDGTVVSYTYDASGRVSTVTRGDTNANDADGVGQTLTYAYDTTTGTTNVTDSAGRTWSYVHDAQGRLTQVLAPAIAGLRDVTAYAYDAANRFVQVKSTRGAQVLAQTDYAYDASGNRTWEWTLVDPARGASAIQRTYDANNQLLTETHYTGLDADGAGSAQAPTGGQTTHYVCDAQSRLRFTIDAAGSVTEYQYAGSGNAIGQQVSVRRYLGAAYTGTTYTLTDLVGWATLAQQANSALTETSYDLWGRISQVTRYANVSATDGSGLFDDSAEVVRYYYDAHGLLRSTITQRSSTAAANDGRDVGDATVYSYDGQGRLLSEVDGTAVLGATPLSDKTQLASQLRTTNWIYLDSAGSLSTTLGTGLQRTQVRDAAGDLVSVTESAVADPTNTRTTRNYYDASGQLRASEDAAGARTYYFYDAKGALVGQVDETGALVETVRDGVGRVTATNAYSVRLDTSGWLVNGAVVPTTYTAPTDPAVRVTTFAYDDAGELLTQTDPAGTITTYTYDAAGRLLQTQVADPADASATRVTRQLYDANGRQVGTLDGEGYLTEFQYDVAGRQVATIRYATATPAAQRASGTLAQLRPATSAQDQCTRSFFDGRNQLVGTLDAEGYLTEYVYDESQHQRAERRYAKQLTGLTGSESFATLRTGALTGAVHETRRTFDALGQLVTELNFEGTVTRYTYDAVGRLTGTVSADATSDVREGHRRYDVFGDLIGELGGEGSTHLVANMSETQLDALYAQYGTRYSYDALGRRIESIDAQGNKTWYFYDAAGRQTFLVRGVAENNAGQTGALNSYAEVTETRYDAFGDVTDSIAYTGRIALGTPGDRASVASALTTLAYVSTVDSKRSQTWTTRGLLASVTDAEGTVTQYAYNAFGELARLDRGVGTGALATTTYAYDHRGLQSGRTEALGTTAQRSTSQVYDAFGRVITATDARGSAASFAYDRLGRLLSESRVVQGRTETSDTTAYDAFGRTLSVTDAEGATTSYIYDDATRSIKVTTPEGIVVTTVHDRHGQTVTVTRALGDVTTYTYDDDGHQLTAKDALDPASVDTYDTRGLLVRTTDASGRSVRIDYDAVGRVLQRVVDPDGSPLVTRYQYDAQGRQLQVTDPSGRATQYSYDREGRLTLEARDPAGLNLRTRYTYDAVGREVTVVSGDGTAAARTVQYAYDTLGRRISETSDPGTGHLNFTTTYAYDANDNVIRRTDATGAVTRYYYDEASRLTCSVDPLGAVTRNWYDADGRMVATRSYAQASELVLADTTALSTIDASLVARPEDQGIYRVYDRDGRLRFTIDLAGTVRETSYDADNRACGTRQYAAAFTPDATLQGKLLAGTALPADIAAVRNDAQDLQSYVVYDAAGHARYTVDALGNVEERYFDVAGRQVGTRRYATALTPANFTAIKAALQAGTTVPTDIASRVVTDDSHDTRSYQVFDAAGRAVFTVDALGAVQRAFYDAAGHQVGQVAYATAITVDATLLAKLKAGASVADVSAKLTSAILTDARNTEHYQVFDAAGRQTDTIEIVRDAAGNASGLVQQTTWDEADGVTIRNALQTTLSNTIVVAHAAELQAGSATHANIMTWLGTTGNTRYTRSLLDAAGRVHYALIRNTGNTLQVTERLYDAMGRVIQETVYGNAIPDTAITDAAVQAAVVGSPSRITRYAYDAAGHLRFQVDDLGGVSERLYDALGRMVEERSYDTRINVTGTLTESAVLAALDAARQTQWSTGFASLPVTGLDTSNVGAFQNALVLSNGQLVLTPIDLDTSTTNGNSYPGIWRTQMQASSDNVVYRSEVTTAGSVSSNYLVYGLDNALSGADYRRTAAYINNGVLYAYSQVGGVGTSRAVCTLAPNTTYVIEADSRSGGADFFVYVKGTDKASGYRFSVAQADKWDSIRMRAWALTRDGAAPGSSLYLDNLSESVAPSRHTSYRYDAAGRLVETTDALGNSEFYGYDARGLMTTRTDKLGNVWTYAYDAAGRKTSETSPAVSVASTSYDSTAKTWSSTTATRAVVTAYTYDALGNVLTKTEDSGQAGARTTTYEYDNRGHQVRTVFPRAWQIDVATGQLLDTLAASEINVTYDVLGRAAVQKDVNGNTSYKVYDNEGRLAYDIDQENYVTRYTYNATGEQLTLTRYANQFNSNLLTGWTAGSPITLAQMATVNALVADPANDRTITTAYDVLGNKTSVTQSAITYFKNDGTSATGSPTTTFAYNTYGELVSQSVLVEGSTWATTFHYYDDLGREVLTVDPEGYVTRTAYDAEGDVTEATEFARAIDASVLSPSTLPAAGDTVVGYDRVTRYTYDALGRKASQTVLRHYERSDGSSAASGVETDFTYDGLDHLLTTTVDGVTMLTSTYDALGRTSNTQEATRDVLRSNVDTLLASVSNDLASAAVYEQASPYTTVTYDAFGNAVTTVRYANGMRNGVATADSTRDQVNLSVYDHQGRAVVQQDAYGNKVSQQYDAADHLTRAWSTLSGSVTARDAIVTAAYQYDKVGRQKSTTITRQLTTGGTVWTERADTVVYDGFGDIVQKTAAGITGTLTYTYDKAGNLTSSNETGATRSFGYNLAGARTWEQRTVSEMNGSAMKDYTETWRQVVDGLGRVIESILPSNTSDRTVVNTVVNTLDRWGNVIEQIDPRGYRTRTEYNETNQATRQVAPQVEVVGEDGLVRWVSPETRWFYDAAGRLTSTRDANGHVKQNVYNDAGQLVGTIDALGAKTTKAYDALGNARMEENALGYLTWQGFDLLGRVTTQGDFLPNATNSNARDNLTRETYTLDQNGDRVRVANGLSEVTQYDYDSQGNLIRSQTPTANVTTYGYDILGHKVLEQNPLGTQLTWVYDIYGRVIDHKDLSGVDFNYTYDAASGQLLTQSSNSDTSATSIPGGLETGASDPMDRADQRTTYYYPNGLVRRIEEPGGVWYSYEYDANGNRTLELNHTYDGRGLLVYTRTRTAYDSHNRIAHVYSEELNADGTTAAVQLDLRYGYDAVGNRRVVVADSGWGYDNTHDPGAPNAAPALIGTPKNQVVKAGIDTQISLRPMDVFQDPEQKDMTFSAALPSGAALPAWLTLDTTQLAASGDLVFTAHSSAAAGQSAIVRLKATDADGNVMTVDFTVSVVSDSAPVASSNSTPVVMITGQPATIELAAGTYFTDADAGDILSIGLDSISPAAPWLTVDTSSPGVLRLSGTPTTVGTYTLTLRATDLSGLTVTRTLQLKTQTNVAPVAATVTAQTAVINRAFLFERSLAQLFTDSNGDRMGLTATLSNGAPLPSWLNLQVLTDTDPPTVRLIGYVPPDTDPQSLSVVVKATDPYGASATLPITVNVIANPGPTVLAPPPTQSGRVYAGYSATFNIADYFRDDQGDPFGLSLVTTTQSNWLTIKVNANGTFTLAGLPGDNSKAGQYDVQVKATDIDGATSLVTVHFNIKSQYPPSFGSTTAVNLITGSPFTITSMTATDPEGDHLTYSANSGTRMIEGMPEEQPLPDWLYFDPATGVFSGTAPSTTYTDTIYITASDGVSSVTKPFTLSVNVNQGVQLTGSIPAGTVAIGNSWTYIVPTGVFTDPEGQTLTYTASQLPAGLSFNPTTRQFSGTPTTAGTYTVVVRATDPGGLYAETSFSLKVNAPPTLAVALPDQSAPATGGTWSYTVPSNTFADANLPSETLTYSASGMPGWMTFNAVSHTFTGTPGAIGSWNITVTATDASGAAVSDTFAVTTSNAAPVVASPIADKSIVVNASWSWAFPTTTFRDYNDAAQVFTYTASGMPAGVTFNAATRTFSGTPTVPGNYTVNVTASDGSLSVTDSFVLTVTNNPPTVQTPIPDASTPMGQPWSYAFPTNTFTDVNGQTLTYSASGMPAGATFNASTRTFSGTPTVLGTYSITVTASDGYATVSDVFVLSVINTPPVYNGGLVNRTINLGTAANWSLPANTFTDPNGQTLSYSAMVEIPAHDKLKWNAADNAWDTVPVDAQWVAASTASLSINAASGLVTGTPVKLTADSVDFYSYRVQIIASDGSLTTGGIFQLSLDRAPTVGTAIPAATLPRNIAWNYVVPATAFNDAEGGLTYSATGLPPGVTFTPSTRTFSGTPTTNGTYTVTVTVTDTGGLTASQTFTVTVQNYAPVVANPIPTQSIPISQAWSFAFASNTFTDANNDTLTYTATGMPPGITFTASTRTFSGTPTTSGNYTVTVTANDGTTTKATTFTITVNHAGAPTLNIPLPDDTADSGIYYEYIIPVNSFNGIGMTYTATLSNGAALPSWLTFNAAQRKFSGTPGGVGDTSYDIKVTATNASGSVSDIFNLYKYGSGGGTMALAAGTSTSPSNPAGGNGKATGKATNNAGGNGSKANSSDGSTTLMAAAAAAPSGPTLLTADQDVTAATAATPLNANGVEVKWYTYDANDRTLVHEGTLQNGQIVIGAGTAGYEQRYDAVGQETLRFTSQYSLQGERTYYDLRGEITGTTTAYEVGGPNSQIVEKRSYDAAGRLSQILRYYSAPYVVNTSATASIDVGGFLQSADTYYYNGDGQVTSVTQLGRSQVMVNGAPKWMADLQPTSTDPTVRSNQMTNLGVLQTVSSTSYDGGTGGKGYDAAGNLLGYTFHVYADGSSPAYNQYYTYTYQAREQYLEKTVSGTSDNSAFKATTVTSYYDAAGRRIAVEEDTPKVTTEHTLRYFSYADGHILTRRDGNIGTNGWYQPAKAGPWMEEGNLVTYPDNPIYQRLTETQWEGLTADQRKTILQYAQDQRFVYVNGQQVSQGTKAGSLSVTSGLTAYGDAGAGRMQVVAQEGDTLRSIALRVYGNADLWYVIADANALHADGDVTAGVELTVPSIKVNSNDASTFRPYNPGEIIGPTTPDMPFIAPPKPHCNMLLAIIIIVIAVIVTIYTAGAAAGAMGSAASAATGATVGGTAVTVGTTASAAIATAGGGFAATMSVGVSALAGSFGVGAAVVGGAVGGFMGSVASQVVGKALGVTDHFSLRSAVAAGIAGGLTAGISTEMGGVGGVSNLIKEGHWGEVAATGAMTAGGSYAANRIAGVKDTHFSWRAIAAEAITSVVAGKINKRLGTVLDSPGISNGVFHDTVGGIVNGVVGLHVRRSLGFDDRVDYGSMAADAFGNALGNAIVSKAQSFVEHPSQEENEDQRAAEDRLYSSATASLDGAGKPVDPMDLTRSRYGAAFASGMKKFGADHVLLNSQSLSPLFYAADAGSGWESKSFGVTFVPEEVQAFVAYANSVGVRDRNMSPETAVMFVAPGASDKEIYANTVENYGRFAADATVLRTAYGDTFTEKSTTDRSYAFNLTPIAKEVAVRYQLALMIGTRAEQERYEQASPNRSPYFSDAMVMRHQPSEKELAYRALSDALNREDQGLRSGGYLPRDKYFRESLTSMLTILGTAAASPVAESVVGKIAAAGLSRTSSLFMRETAVEAREIFANVAAEEAPAAADLPEGSFSIADWSGYPAEVPKPQGPFRVVEGPEYDAARAAANKANSHIRRQQGLIGQPVDVHETQPVKFGGSPTDSANKVVLPRDVHRQQVTPWWNQLQRDLGY